MIATPTDATSPRALVTVERVGRLWQRIRPDRAPVTADTELIDQACLGRHLVALVDRLGREFGVEVMPAELVAARSVAGIVSLIEERLGSGQAPVLVRMRAGGRGMPLVFLSGSDGTFARLFEITRFFPEGHSCWGFEAPGLRRGERPRRSIRALAHCYAAEIDREFAGAPVVLLGFCMGGTVAHEVVRQRAAGGHPTPLLVLGDTPCPAVVRMHRPWSSRSHRTRERWVELARWFTTYDTGRLQGRIRRNRRTYSMAALGHRPSPIATDTVLLTSDAYRRRFASEDLGWRPFLHSRLTLIESGRMHRDVLRREPAQVMGTIGQQLTNRGL